MTSTDIRHHCTLTEPVCDDHRCRGCGWEEQEHKRRMELLHTEMQRARERDKQT